MDTRNHTHTKQYKAITFWIRRKNDDINSYSTDLLDRVRSKFPQKENTLPYEVGLVVTYTLRKTDIDTSYVG